MRVQKRHDGGNARPCLFTAVTEAIVNPANTMLPQTIA
jgi:hypothetical protein